MGKKPIIFIAFQEQDNLGVGYIASRLQEAGYDFKIIDFRFPSESILEILREYQPLIVGFSVIFQYHIKKFSKLIEFLRENGIRSHFCAGGHYPSLRSREILELIPGLDSVLRFEGEYIFRELADAIYGGLDWKSIQSLAYIQNGVYVTTPIRPLEENLDVFTPPVRPALKEYAFGRKYATMIAGRGCYYQCAFCSIRQFYSKPKGSLKRIRQPELVAKEMELLNQQCGADIFMFQDDDFPVYRASGLQWVERFCNSLDSLGLSSHVLWKINCRPDEVDKTLFERMKDAGLFLVYLGIEAGTDVDLDLMNKHTSAKTNLRAAEILNDLDIGFDFGFMLLHPYSTIQSVRDNLLFLFQLCGSGYSSVTFCKMLPYAETEIEQRLIRENRIRGDIENRDYDFLDERLDQFHHLIEDMFFNWMFHNGGLLNLSRWARHYVLAAERLYGNCEALMEIKHSLRLLVAESNSFFLDSVTKVLDYCEESKNGQASTIVDLRTIITKTHDFYLTKTSRYMDQITELVTHQRESYTNFS